MFHMVKFSGMETVAVVPAEWYNAGQTLWPNYKTDKCMERAVQRRETPGEDWDRYNCTVLKTYDNYSAAHQALKSLSCSTSDVQSDEGEEVNAKPKPIHYIGESDADSDQNESRTPLKKQRTHQKVHRFPSSSTQTVVPPTKPHTMSSKMTPPLLAPPASVIPCPEMNTSSWEGQLLFHPTCRVRTGTGPILCTAAQLHMLTLMEQVKHEQNQILGMLNGLNTKLDANTELQSFFDTPEDLKFPLDTIEDVEHFEAWLAEATNAGSKNNLIKILSTLGGQDVKKVTWNILAHIFSDNVSKKICWKGANQKLKFSGMNTKGLLIRAVRNCKVSSNATEEEISKHAIRWFNLASDRGGGRKERHRLSTAGRTTDEQNSE